jgi:hypothetical protein
MLYKNKKILFFTGLQLMEKVQKGNIQTRAGLQADTWLDSEKAAVALGKKRL